MSHSERDRPRLRAAAAAILLLPALALAQQPGAERSPPPLSERVRTLDESLQQEHDELVQRVAADARDGGRLAAALKTQQAAWLQYRDASCALAGMLDSPSSTRALQCRAEWSEAQRLRMWSLLDCLGQVPPAERAAEQDRCLQALVSLPRP